MTAKHTISTLPNGARLIVTPMHDADSVSVHFFVGAGGRYEKNPADHGAAHFIEHLLFKGTRKRPKAKMISEQINGVGGIVNAYTALDHTCFYIKLPKKHFALALDILVDILTDPLFEIDEIERERKVVVEEMNLYRDDPARHVYDMVGPLLWPNNPLKSNIIGDDESVGKMNRERILAYFNRLYRTNNIVISVAGNVRSVDTEKKVIELFSNYKSSVGDKYQLVDDCLSDKISSFSNQSTNQTHLVVAGRAPSVFQDDEPAFKVLNTLLGTGMSSRLYVGVREEKGLAYDISMTTSTFYDTGSFEIYAGVKNIAVEQALRAIVDEIDIVVKSGTNKEELAKVKEQLRGRMIMSLENNSAVADMFGSQLIVADRTWSLDEILSTIDKVSIEDVLRVAQKYLAHDKLRLALIGPHTKETTDKLEAIISKG